MVLTDLPFARSSRLESRYNLIRPVQRSESAPPGKHGRPDRDDASNTSSEEYATFLKQKERSVGPDGFLDSSRYCHPFQTRSKKSPRKPTTSQSMRTLPTGASLSARISEDDKNYEKRLKVIEDHMWHHKQEGRELKRLEGDVLKNQQAVRRSLRDYENVVSKKRRNEEKKLSKGLEKYTVLQLENSHRKEELNKQRTHDNINKGQRLKDVDRKTLLIEANIRRQFELKEAELELKQDQRMKTNKAFEEKIRTQEEEEFQLQKELAELAIGLNMEAQKRRQMTFDNDSKQKRETTKMIKSDLAVEKSLQSELTKGDEIIKDAEMTKRKLSAGLERTKAHMSIKARDEQRRLTDTQIRLADNASMQRRLNDAAKFADLDLKAKKIDQRLQAHTERREAQLSSRFKDKREREEAQHVALQEKFRKRYNEQRRKDHDDKLKFFQKMATKAEETEQNLYNKVRNAEYARQKQEQTLKHLQMELANLKRENAKRINSEMAACLRTEKEYEERLLREKADLDKAHARREESYGHLQNHRAQMKEDLYQLQEYSREQERLNKIGLRSESESHLFP